MDPKIIIESEEILSKNWHTLKKTTFQYKSRRGNWQSMQRETYDRGNGAVILLYNPQAGTVVLTRQFRFPTFVNGNSTGMLIEACAGLLDKDTPEDAIRRETQEETGFHITQIEKVFEAYMSPGSVTELLYFFIASYSKDTLRKDGGGVEAEQEEIEVLEIKFTQALQMIETGEICDGKTIMLLQYLQLKGLMKSA